MIRLTLKEIAELAGGTAVGDAEVTSVVIDSRKAVPESLYIAIKGQRLDGHAFIDGAAELGAAAAMIHCDCECNIPYVKVDDTTKALLRFAANYRNKFNPIMIGLTGSVGKTSTKDMTACAVSTKYNTIKTQGNFNNHIGMPLNLLRLDESVEAAVIEMGMSARGEIERLTTAVKPDIGIITNIGISHIGMLGSRQEILNAKMEIIEGIKKGGTLILNGDDDMLSTVKEAKGLNIIRYSLVRDDVDVKGKITEEADTYSMVTVSCPLGKYKMIVPVHGRHNVYNALAAFTAAVAAGVTPEDACRGISEFVPMAMRLNVYEKEGITIIEDCYNAAPDSMSAALSRLSVTGFGRKVAVFSDMLELGDYSPEAHMKVGREAASVVDCLYVYGAYAEYYKKGFEESGTDKEIKIFDDKKTLTEFLKTSLKAGDTVLFKASRLQKLEEVIEEVFA